MFKDKCAKKQKTVRRVALFAIGSALLLSANLGSTAMISLAAAGAQKRAVRTAAQKKPRVDYSRFSHHTHVVNEKLPCASCHKFPAKNWKDVRSGNEAFPDSTEYPQHQSCLNCHRTQFFSRERLVPRICSNCHVNATPV